MSGIIGKKIGMTSLFNEEGKNIPCTVIQAGPCSVLQVRTIEKDGYKSVQLGFDDKSEKNVSKALAGHFKRLVQLLKLSWLNSTESSLMK